MSTRRDCHGCRVRNFGIKWIEISSSLTMHVLLSLWFKYACINWNFSLGQLPVLVVNLSRDSCFPQMIYQYKSAGGPFQIWALTRCKWRRSVSETIPVIINRSMQYGTVYVQWRRGYAVTQLVVNIDVGLSCTVPVPNYSYIIQYNKHVE